MEIATKNDGLKIMSLYSNVFSRIGLWTSGLLPLPDYPTVHLIFYANVL